MTDMTNANFPCDGEGRTYHLYVKPGEVANRVLTVGDRSRAEAMSKLPGFEVKFTNVAPRLFTTITGLYKGVPVSIVTSLMGLPNMDFTVRELRHCIQGPAAFIRIGTCGTPSENIKVGEVSCPSDYHTVLRNPDAVVDPEAPKMFISKAIHSNDMLQGILREHCLKECGTAYEGHSLSCCSFYSTQGRTDPNFDDKNADFIDYFCETIPNLVSIEMESSHLMDLARICNKPIYAAAAHIILAQRRSLDFLTNEQKHAIETKIGTAALDALIEFKFPEGEPEPVEICK